MVLTKEHVNFILVTILIVGLLYQCKEMFEGLNVNEIVSNEYNKVYGDGYVKGWQNQFYGSRDPSKSSWSSEPTDYAAGSLYKPCYGYDTNRFDVSHPYDIANPISPGNPASRMISEWARPYGPGQGDYNDELGGYRKLQV
jgi:hypothetical protein